MASRTEIVTEQKSAQATPQPSGGRGTELGAKPAPPPTASTTTTTTATKTAAGGDNTANGPDTVTRKPVASSSSSPSSSTHHQETTTAPAPAPATTATTTTTTTSPTRPLSVTTSIATNADEKKRPHSTSSSHRSRPSTSSRAAAAAAAADGKTATEKNGNNSNNSSSRPSTSSKNNVSHDEDGTNPLDFAGSVDTTNLHVLPSQATIRKIDRHLVLDRNGKSHTFRSLYTGKHVARRVLVIFVRHFYCGNCQQYLALLSKTLPPQLLLGLPIPTFIVVIGCGDPGLIDMYVSETNCPFPVYSDPTRKLYEELGMIRTLALGQRPAYMQSHIIKSSVTSVVQGLKQIKSGLALKGGDQRQIGGEFLFEPLEPEAASPILERKGNGLGETIKGPEDLGIRHRDSETPSIDGKNMELGGDGFEGVDKVVSWCHRMKNTRDHAEVPELMEVLGIDPGLVNLDVLKGESGGGGGGGGGGGKAAEKHKAGDKEKERWERAMRERKGTGFSVTGKRVSGVFGGGGGKDAEK